MKISKKHHQHQVSFFSNCLRPNNIGAFFVCWVLGGFANVLAAGPKDPSTFFFHQTWGDFQEELQRAKEEGKTGILLFFEMDECPYCHRMKQSILNQPTIQTYFRKHFLLFPVDIEGQVEITDFKGRTWSEKDYAFRVHRVRATPVLLFFDLSGQVITRYTGAPSSLKEFMWLGQFVVEGHYKSMPFTRYKRQQRHQK